MNYELCTLKTQVQTKDYREGTRIHVAVETAGHLRIQTLILRNSKHVVHSCIYTSAQRIEQIRETVTKRNVVTLQERSVVNIVVSFNILKILSDKFI